MRAMDELDAAGFWAAAKMAGRPPSASRASRRRSRMMREDRAYRALLGQSTIAPASGSKPTCASASAAGLSAAA